MVAMVGWGRKEGGVAEHVYFSPGHSRALGGRVPDRGHRCIAAPNHTRKVGEGEGAATHYHRRANVTLSSMALASIVASSSRTAT